MGFREPILVLRVRQVGIGLGVAFLHELLVEHLSAHIDISQEPVILVYSPYIELQPDPSARQLVGGEGARLWPVGLDSFVGVALCLKANTVGVVQLH